MANLTTFSYFVGEYIVHNITGTHPAVTVNAADLNWFIAKYEKEYLKMVMGDTLYDEFVTGISQGSPETKWTELKAQLWDSTNYVSPVAAYIWARQRQAKLTQSSEMGEQKANVENGAVVSSDRKMIDAYNYAMSEGYLVAQWIQERYTTYTTQDTDLSRFDIRNDFGI